MRVPHAGKASVSEYLTLGGSDQACTSRWKGQSMTRLVPRAGRVRGNTYLSLEGFEEGTTTCWKGLKKPVPLVGKV